MPSNEVSNGFSKLKPKTCDEKIEAITDMASYGNASVRDVHLKFPDTRVDQPQVQRLDPHKKWTEEEFTKQCSRVVADAMGGDGDKAKPTSLDFSFALPDNAEKTGLIKARDSQYFRLLLDKMMDYASSKYLLANLDFNGDEFNQFYRDHLDNLKKCSDDVDLLKKNITDSFASNSDKEAEMVKLKDKINENLNDLEGLEKAFDERNKEFAEQIGEVDIEIEKAEQLKLSYIDGFEKK